MRMPLRFASSMFSSCFPSTLVPFGDIPSCDLEYILHPETSPVIKPALP